MAKATMKELYERLAQSHDIIEKQMSEISKLHKELDATRKGLNMVSSSEYNSVITELEQNKKLYKVLSEGYERENTRLKHRVDELIDKVKELENNSTVIKTEHNSRGAGRKEFSDFETVKRIFDMYASGKSLQNIADVLNGENIKTKSGGAWAKSSVRFILLNHSYVERAVIDEKVYNLITERLIRKK